MRFRGASVSVLLLLCAACRERTEPVRPAATAAATPTATSAAAATSSSGAASASASAARAEPEAGDAGVGDAAAGTPAPGVCVALAPPRQLSFTGPMALSFADGAPAGEPPRAIFNIDGAARGAQMAPLPQKQPKGAPAPDAGGEFPAEPATPPGCAIAAGQAFCMSKSGNVLRSRATGEEARVIATARPGTSLAAASIGDHLVLALLANLRTTEGVVLQAYAKLDDGPPQKLSEDGSGATYVTLAPWRGGALVLYIDERRSMSPVHARFLSVRTDAAGASTLDIGRDAVVFVGDGGSGRMTGAIATGPGGAALGLVATGRTQSEFGMAAIRIEDPLRDDAPTAWSTYPRSGLSVPIEATQGNRAMVALRSRPASAAPDGRYALELGNIDPSGNFRAACVVAEGSAFTDPRIAVDAEDTLWLAYTTGGKSYLERRSQRAP